MFEQNTSRNIFVSYKYADADVAPLTIGGGLISLTRTQAKDYVTDLANRLNANDYIYKGENDGESLEDFKDEAIESKLRDKIFGTTVTIVLISKNMKDATMNEDNQWIPWEVSYSLKEMTRNGRTSGTNGMLAVVLPDRNNSYSYMVNHYPCATVWNTASLFKILNVNMFNRNQKNLNRCSTCGNYHHIGQNHSYIYPVKWHDFIKDINFYINLASQMKQDINDFDISKVV